MSTEKLHQLSLDILSEESAILLNKYMVENSYLKASLAIAKDAEEKASEAYVKKCVYSTRLEDKLKELGAFEDEQA